MIKTVLTAVWVCVVAFGVNYGYGLFKERRASASTRDTQNTLEVRKLKEMSVPTIRDGAVKGYIVVKLSYVSDTAKLTALGISTDPFLADEAFSYLYSDQSIDYNKLERYDVEKFKATVMKRTNARVRADVVTDITLQEFNYMSSTEVGR